MPEATLGRPGDADEPPEWVFRQRTEAEAYVASVCFKHGPPRLTGVELEWTVHHRDDPARPLRPAHLADALAPHTPRLLDPASPAEPLPGGGTITVEPGGQVEISSAPSSSLAGLYGAMSVDVAYLAELLARSGLTLGEYALDPVRAPHRILRTPRYEAMERAFAPFGEHGITMMCSTAAIQVCVDVGPREAAATRWAAAHALGPVFVAAFANSPVRAGLPTGWASARLRSVLGADDVRTAPGPFGADPAAEWATRALDTPLLCLRRPGQRWDAPAGVSFADWIDGGLPDPPTSSDLDYHLSTFFTPVRPRGYLELRYIDAQPAGRWFTPVALLVAILAEERTTAAALQECAPVAGQWLRAARCGTSDPELRRIVRNVLHLGCEALQETDLDSTTVGEITETLERGPHSAARLGRCGGSQ